jgi:DtxR family Mn-dependent transcriptional regulator
MTIHHLNESIEMYLKTMLEMGDRQPLMIPRLAERLGVTPVSANEMVRKLGEMGLSSHVPYKGVTLTEKGSELARNVMRRQRLWEVFLYQHLKIEWALIYEFACSLEHATAPEVTEALSAFLGNPVTCPRGNPIPAPDGSFATLEGIPLNEAPVGSRARVQAVNATETEVLRYLQACRLLPGQDISIVAAAPLQGPLTLQVEDTPVVIGLQAAEFVLIQITPKEIP